MSTTRSHIKLDHDRRIVTWTLPASQLGTRGPTLDISLKCTCAIAGKRLCPYHNMATILDLTMATPELGADDDQTIFRQGAQDSTELLGYIHQMLLDSHTQVQGSHSNEPITNIFGDLPRALGTRFLARLGFSTKLILLLARWDSPTILQHLIGGTLADLQHQAESLHDRDTHHQTQPDEELDKMKAEIQADLSELATVSPTTPADRRPEPNTAVSGRHTLPQARRTRRHHPSVGMVSTMRLAVRRSPIHESSQRQPILPALFHPRTGSGHRHW